MIKRSETSIEDPFTIATSSKLKNLLFLGDTFVEFAAGAAHKKLD